MGEARCFKLDMEIDYVEYWHMHDRLPRNDACAGCDFFKVR